MALSLTADGLLPSGAHDTTLIELKDLFIDGARFRVKDRRLTWSAVGIWSERVHLHFGPSMVWLAGGLLSDRNIAPTLRALVFPRTPSMVARAISSGTGFSLLTIEDVLYSTPGGGWTPRVIPVGGWVDAAFGNVLDLGAAELLWSLALSAGGSWTDTEAGYVRLEV